MKLIVGLGNPGKQYEGTRHNMGFMVLDKLAEMCGVDFDRELFKGVYGICKREEFKEPIIFAKPETFMNNSGEFIRPLMDYYKIGIDDVLIVYDDMALPEGTIRLRPFGSSGSHNGMKSIINHLKSEKFKRLRVGIGEPPYSGIDYVLTKPKGESLEKVDEATTKAAKAIRDYLLNGWDYAMNHYN